MQPIASGAGGIGRTFPVAGKQLGGNGRSLQRLLQGEQQTVLIAGARSVQGLFGCQRQFEHFAGGQIAGDSLQGMGVFSCLGALAPTVDASWIVDSRSAADLLLLSRVAQKLSGIAVEAEAEPLGDCDFF